MEKAICGVAGIGTEQTGIILAVPMMVLRRLDGSWTEQTGTIWMPMEKWLPDGEM